MEECVPTRLDAVAADKLGQKLRLTGQVLAYDAYTGVVLLRAGDVGVLVDASNCVSAWTRWLKERLCMVLAIGYLERAPSNLRVPPLPEHFPLPAPRVDDGLVLRAILVVAEADLEMENWKIGTAKENVGSRKPALKYPRDCNLPSEPN
ncbi:hypothetical protein B0H19DRAFT_1093415 [Mycena capillaripes]|nr:hypothetical protein B0H19DRAFT_1093415 [Mycena capillaripes]